MYRRITELGGKCSACGEYVSFVASRSSLLDFQTGCLLGLAIGFCVGIAIASAF